MTREECINELGEWLEQMIQHGVPSHSAKRKALATAIALLSAESEQTVYCMECAKSAPLDEHGALWYCKAHDRTTLRHSYCNNGERKGGQVHYYGKNADIYVIDEHIESEVDK